MQRAALEEAIRRGLVIPHSKIARPEAERWRRPAWVAQPVQAAFLACPADECLFGGAAGGGKSDGLLAWAEDFCWRHPGAQGLIVRRKYADLIQPRALIPRSFELFAGTGWRWQSGNTQWVAPDGSKIKFDHAYNDAEVVEKYQGAQPEFIGIEEAGQFTPFAIDFLIGRCRTAREGVQPQVRLTANPGGPAHSYLYRRYVEPADSGRGRGVVWQPTREENQTVDPPTRCFIPALIEDNPALLGVNPSYLAKLENLPEPLRSAYRYGLWNIFVGQFFMEWQPAIHVCEPFDPPAHWPRIAAMDWGYSHPTVFLWAAVSPEGIVYIYRELALRYKTVEELAERFREYGDNVPFVASGPDVFTLQSMRVGGPTVAEEFGTHGVTLLNPTAGRRRIHQWQQVRRYLRATDEDGGRLPGLPLLRVMEGRAPKLCSQMPDMVYDRDDPEDMEKTDIDRETGEGGDDAVDALAYLLMQRPWAAVDDKIALAGPLSVAARTAEKRAARARSKAGSLLR